MVFDIGYPAYFALLAAVDEFCEPLPLQKIDRGVRPPQYISENPKGIIDLTYITPEEAAKMGQSNLDERVARVKFRFTGRN